MTHWQTWSGTGRAGVVVMRFVIFRCNRPFSQKFQTEFRTKNRSDPPVRTCVIGNFRFRHRPRFSTVMKSACGRRERAHKRARTDTLSVSPSRASPERPFVHANKLCSRSSAPKRASPRASRAERLAARKSAHPKDGRSEEIFPSARPKRGGPWTGLTAPAPRAARFSTRASPISAPSDLSTSRTTARCVSVGQA